MNSQSTISQQLLEQNEDILAAIVENLQLGRLSDCMQHYSILHANLVSLSSELYNFPPGDENPHQFVGSFPDEIMRKDLLDDLLPKGSRPVPLPPQLSPCSSCMEKKNSVTVCRDELKHADTSGNLSAEERDSFCRAAQVIYARHQQNIQQNSNSEQKMKRNYKLWTPYEKYTAVIALCLYGPNITKLLEALPERSENQIRSYVVKKLRNGEGLSIDSVKQLMDERPKGYQPPKALAEYFVAHASGVDIKAKFAMQLEAMKLPKGSRKTAVAAIVEEVKKQETPETTQTNSDIMNCVTSSALSPQAGKLDFDLLLSIAADINTINLETLSSFSSRESLAQGAMKPNVPIITDVGMSLKRSNNNSNKVQNRNSELLLQAANAAIPTKYNSVSIGAKRENFSNSELLGPPLLASNGVGGLRPVLSTPQFVVPLPREPISQSNGHIHSHISSETTLSQTRYGSSPHQVNTTSHSDVRFATPADQQPPYTRVDTSHAAPNRTTAVPHQRKSEPNMTVARKESNINRNKPIPVEERTQVSPKTAKHSSGTEIQHGTQYRDPPVVASNNNMGTPVSSSPSLFQQITKADNHNKLLSAHKDKSVTCTGNESVSTNNRYSNDSVTVGTHNPREALPQRAAAVEASHSGYDSEENSSRRGQIYGTAPMPILHGHGAAIPVEDSKEFSMNDSHSVFPDFASEFSFLS